MNPNGVGNKGANKNQAQRQEHNELTRLILEGTTPPEDPNVKWTNYQDQEQRISKPHEEDVEGNQSRSSVYQTDYQGQQTPRRRIINRLFIKCIVRNWARRTLGYCTYSGGDRDPAYFCLEQIQFCQNTSQYGKCRNCHGHTQEEEIRCEGGRMIGRLNSHVQGVAGSSPSCKWQHHPGQWNCQTLDFLRIFGSNSNPTRKRNKTSPKFDTKLRNGSDLGGKTVSKNIGTWPRPVGPRMMPEIISLMTLGCLIGDRINFTSRDMQIIIRSWMINVGKGLFSLKINGFRPDRNPPSMIFNLCVSLCISAFSCEVSRRKRTIFCQMPLHSWLLDPLSMGREWELDKMNRHWLTLKGSQCD